MTNSKHVVQLLLLSSPQPGDEYRTGGCNITGNIGGHYRPFGNGPPGGNYNLSCNPDMLTGCEVGDLTGKHATINVPGEKHREWIFTMVELALIFFFSVGSPSPYRDDAFFFTDSFLNLTGTYSVADRSIAIHEANRGMLNGVQDSLKKLPLAFIATYHLFLFLLFLLAMMYVL